MFRVSEGRTGTSFIIWALGTAVWSGSGALRLAATAQFHEQFWYGVRFLGVTVAGAGFFFIAAAYTTRARWFKRRALLAVLAVPTVTNLLAWTSGFHGLLWTVDGQAGLLVANPAPGPWFLVHALWGYALVLAGSYWLVESVVQTKQRLYQGQGGLILLAVVLGLTPNLLYLGSVTAIDWTPIGNAAAALTLMTAVFRYRVFNISPIARDVVVRNIDKAMIVADEQYSIVDVNERANAIFDRDIDDLLGMSVEELLGTSFEIDKTTDGGNSDLVSLDVEDEQRLFEITESEIQDTTDASLGHVLLLSDVTEQQRQRQRLEQQNRELERQNERLDKFASVISHDLRNPLSVAQLRLDLAEQEVENEHTREVATALERMETMIHEILTMARADTVVEETESIRLYTLAEAAWNTVETSNAELELDVPENTTVEGNWSLLRNAFENLFRNAIEHNDQPVTIRVGTGRDSPGVADLFFIEDDGVGIPDEERERVFEFGHTTSDSGTGFGLAIVDELVDAHGWRIDVTDSDEGGARFEIKTQQY